MRHFIMLLLAVGFAHAAEPLDRADPSRWVLWRCGNLPFPTEMFPQVPETLEAGPAVEFGPGGSDLAIVIPDDPGESHDGQALHGFLRLIQDKVPKAAVVKALDFIGNESRRHVLILGTRANNCVAHKAGLDDLHDIPPGGYRITSLPNRWQQGGRIILALGADDAGAWAAAGIMAFAIHPKAERLGAVQRFPVKLPEGVYWAPFEARCTTAGDTVQLPPEPTAPTHRPRVPFGVRLWGSPMPDLVSYQRMVRALKPLGINTIVVQPGGWPDMADAPQRFRTALDIAWREGLFTVLYAGNEMAAHLPAPLTANHRAIVTTCNDHPGLLSWHLYNQLAAKLTPAQNDLVRDELQWLRSQTKKPVANEIVWGHNVVPIPEDKIQLIQNAKSWGMTTIASDYAPLGGWSHEPALDRWEGRFLQLKPFGLPTEAVLQAHVPFLDPIIPTAAELRNQFWWALAGGARAFYFETACLYTHLSMRGLLSWDLRPLPDGRCDEIARLASTARRLEAVIADSEPLPETQGFTIDPPNSQVALRVRKAADRSRYLLLINRSLDTAASVMIRPEAQGPEQSALELYPGTGQQLFSATRPLSAGVPPAGGACFQIFPPH